MAGCEERAKFDRWPMEVVVGPSSAMDAGWRSPAHPQTLEAGDAEPVTVASPITALAASPDLEGSFFGLLVFHEEGVDRCGALLVADGPVAVRGEFPLVRSAPVLDWRRDRAPCLLSALLTGGATDAPAPPDGGEPPPWLLGGEVRLAWFEGSEFVIGESELPADVNPWRLRTGRFAGEQNLLVFVYNEAPFDEVMRRRPWIYRVVEGEDGLPHLDPRWRGTSFAHPFRDATFCDLTGTGEGEIAALEVAEDGGWMLTAYRFEGFGLEGMAPSLELPEVEDRIEAVHLDRNATDELLVHATGRPPRFIFYGLRGPEPVLLEVAQARAPQNLLGWVPLREEAGRFEIFCLLRDGSTQVVEVPTGAQPAAP